jgi:hypothetical protein
MDVKLEALEAKIANLKEKKKKMEEDGLKRLKPCINNAISNGVDLQILAGMILDTANILNVLPHNREAWQVAGEKFLQPSSPKTKSTTS